MAEREGWFVRGRWGEEEGGEEREHVPVINICKGSKNHTELQVAVPVYSCFLTLYSRMQTLFKTMVLISEVPFPFLCNVTLLNQC